MPRPAPASRSPGLALFLLVLKALWVAFVIATPLLGAWVASSLSAYAGGRAELAAAAGLLLFPIAPLAWEGFAAWRRRRGLRGVVKPPVLTFGDRLILRTLALNLLFLGALVGTRPAPTFAALSTRGDWMLDGRTGPQVDAARRFLLRAADRLEWLYLAVHEDEFARKGDKDKDQGKDTPPPLPTSSATPTPVPVPTTRPDPSGTDHPRPSGGGTSPETTWPVAARIHPAVASMPPDAEKSIASVARYIADRDSSPAGRLKAAHDWVADRIAYDAPSYAAHVYPPQDAQAVFDRRVGVCAGYAQLLAALGKALGLEVAYVTGDARTDGMRETGEGHAWNAARVDGRYFLIDATWDSGTIDGTKFEKHYRTDYYLTPPDIFSVDHFPSDERWQLRKTPLSRGDFFRQPMMTPAFHAEHRELISPTRSQVTVHGPVEILMRGPAALFTTAAWTRRGSHEQTHCAVTRGEVTKVQCDLPAAGAYSVVLFSNTEEYGSYHYIGQIEANRED